MGKDQEGREALLTQLVSARLFRQVSARLMDRLGLTEYIAEKLTDKAVEETWRSLDEYDSQGRSASERGVPTGVLARIGLLEAATSRSRTGCGGHRERRRVVARSQQGR